jgi:hypothetical protein
MPFYGIRSLLPRLPKLEAAQTPNTGGTGGHPPFFTTTLDVYVFVYVATPIETTKTEESVEARAYHTVFTPT